jgi:uncharacterized protein (DUF1800 family)
MGDEHTILSEAEARHFLRRTGFGAKPSEVSDLTGSTRGEAADRALAFPPSKKGIGGGSVEISQTQWFRYILKRGTPGLQERLVLFFHDHFATSNAVVGRERFMGKQQSLIRLHCRQSFKTLVKAMNLNPAMMIFLDTVRNEKFIPNENYARELLELFTLGVTDLDGNPNYVQDDIVQIARAFTGWRYTNGGKPYLDPADHDTKAEFPERGDKRIFTQTGGFGPGGRQFDDQGEGAQEIDRVVDHIFDHRDSDGEKTVARRLAARLLEYFCHGGHADPAVAKPVATAVVAASGFDVSWNVGALVRAILVHDAFYETASLPPYSGSDAKSVSWPVDYIVTTLRLLGLTPRGGYGLIAGNEVRPLWEHSSNMGQRLYEPPSVFGWDWEESWVTSAAMLARYEFARDVTTARYSPADKARFDPGTLIDLGLTDGGDVVDAVVDACGVTGLYTAAERDILIGYLTDGNPGTPLDLTDDDVRNRKLHGLFMLVLQSPAYQLR